MTEAMRTDDRHIAWVRAQIAGDQAAMHQLTNKLSEPGNLDPIAPLIYCAFVLAVRKAFGTQFTRGEVIRLAANVRSALALSGLPAVLDPVAAESEIRRALGDAAPQFPDADACAAAHMAVLDYLVHDMELDDSQIGELLHHACQMITDAQPG